MKSIISLILLILYLINFLSGKRRSKILINEIGKKVKKNHTKRNKHFKKNEIYRYDATHNSLGNNYIYHQKSHDGINSHRNTEAVSFAEESKVYLNF